MKRPLIIVIVIVVILFIIYRLFAGTYNKMVAADETVANAWSQVENVYQRRLDLIPNLVATVKGAADFEQTTLTKVIEARASATQVRVDPKNLTPEALQKFQEAQGQLSSALGRLMVVAEQYPNLKANQNFLDLQSQLEGTENRITVERMKFNDAAQAFNTYVRKFPQNLIAGMFGFSRKAYFEAEKGAAKPPQVDFK